MQPVNIDFFVGGGTLTAAILAEIAGGDTGGLIATPVTTVGNGTLPAAALLGGIITRSGPTAAFTDTTDTAAALVAALGPNIQVGQTFEFTIKNLTLFQQTLAGGAGVTPSASNLIPPLTSASYFGTVGGTQAAPTVVLTHIDNTSIHIPGTVTSPQNIAVTTVGAGTIPAAAINTGYLARSGPTAAFTDTLDTAVNLLAGVAAIANILGSSQEFTYVNNSAWVATISPPTNVSVVGQTVVPANSWVKYVIQQTTAGVFVLTAVGAGYFPAVGVTPAANGVTPVTVANAAVTANSKILLTVNTPAGTVHAPFVATKTPGTGFTFESLAGDTSTYDYEIRG